VPGRGADLPAAAKRLMMYQHAKATAEQRGDLAMLADMFGVVRTGLLTVGAVYLAVWALGLLG
jgi:hypothetical protein